MTEDSPRWQPGDPVVLRYLTRDGRPGMSWPSLVVEDRQDLLALFIPEGATYKQWRVTRSPDGTPSRTLEDARWRRDTLRLMYPGRAYSIWLSWDREGEERRFRQYYVNLEEPFRRTRIGVDTNDHALDVVVAPDLTWTWKDEDELERRGREGIYYPDFVRRVRAEAEEAVARLEARQPPFTGEWLDWLPSPGWGVPALAAEWETEPPALWPDRLGSYADADAPRA